MRMLVWGLLLCLLFVWPSHVEGQSPAPSPLGATPCPLNFTVLDLYPYVADKVKESSDPQYQCAALRGGLEMVFSVYLRETGYFLPPKGSSSACLDAYSKQLMNQGVNRNIDIAQVCNLNNSYLERGGDLCKGVQTADDFAKLVPTQLLMELNDSCSVSLLEVTSCGICNAAVVKMAASVQQAVRPNNSTDSCDNFTVIYTAGVVSIPGPLDRGTALCLLYIRAVGGGSGSTHLVYIAVGVGGILVLSSAAALYVYYRHRKIKEAKRKAEAQRTTYLLESSRVPHSSVNWFTIDEIKAATGNFNRGNLLGSGGYGNVYKGTLKDGSLIAVKRFKNCSPAGDSNFVHEVEMISSVRHRHLVAIRGCCVDRGGNMDGHQRIILYDYMPNGSLQDHLFSKKPGDTLDWPTRFKIAVGMAKGLAYLHHDALPAIIHRDIKASNILLDVDFNARLADFGLAKFTPEGVSHLTTKVAGTYGYVAPEYALYGQLTEKSDVYSFGMVLLELVSGKKALSSGTDDPPHTLVSDWAWPLVKQRKWNDVIDKRLNPNGEEQAMERFILVALLCSHPQVYYRPTIGQALKMLESNVGIPNIPDRPIPLTSNKTEIEAALGGHDGLSNRTGFSSYSSSSVSTHSRDLSSKSPTSNQTFGPFSEEPQDH